MTTTPARIEIRQARGFSELISVVFDFLRENFKLLGKSVLYIVGPAALLMGWLTSGSVAASSSIDALASGMQSVGLSLLSFLMFFVIGVLIVAVVNSYVFLYMEREPGTFDVKDIWQETKSNLGNVAGTSIVLGGLGLVGFIVIPIMMAFSVFIGVLVAAAFIILAVYFVVALLPVWTLRLYEDLKFSEAVARSRELVSENWWSTFGIVAVPYVIATILGVVAGSPAYVVQWVMLMDPTTFEMSNGLALIVNAFSIFGTVASMLLYAIPALAATFQYFNLVEKLDGVGMMDRIEYLGATDNEVGNLTGSAAEAGEQAPSA